MCGAVLVQRLTGLWVCGELEERHGRDIERLSEPRVGEDVPGPAEEHTIRVSSKFANWKVCTLLCSAIGRDRV